MLGLSHVHFSWRYELQEAEPYLLDLFAAACWDASETPTVEGARQFWAHLGWQIC